MKIAAQCENPVRLGLAALTVGWVLWGCSSLSTPPISPASPAATVQAPQAPTSPPASVPTPASDVAFALPELAQPIAGTLGDNVVITEWDFVTSTQLFDRVGQGIAVVAENRNYAAVDLWIKVIFYRDNQVSVEVPSGPYPLEGRQSILVPVPVDRQQLLFDFYDVVTTQVAPR